ncbi:WD40/YVTN/BNR-like repeat-containing protein [Halorussus ruber]|uniref:WD40/YVTN/BNR-like repeat-containing protein n=1 Tax=Halorussus ruber TaxID=1126238 RepID=UPI001092C0E6|nr:WD40 repeat domain-containing protein [Halorussus ruber]
MLLVGSDDGVYRAASPVGSGAAEGPEETDAERVLRSGRVLRVETFDGVSGAFAATKTGLYHSHDGEEWTNLDVPREEVYAVGASEGRIYAGTRPAHVYVAEIDGSGEISNVAWRDLDGFRELAERDDWGIDRHENVAQVRDVRVHPESPERVVAGVEVGGVYASDDGGETWRDGRIEGFDAPHTDDIHHLALADGGTIVAATGSGLYRTTDTGRSWARLDDEHRQSYFRESLVRDGETFVGGSPTPPSSWEEDRDHALFEYRTDREESALESVPSPTPEEVAVGWCEYDGDAIGVTHRGTLLRRGADEWGATGSVPAPESVHGRCIPLAQFEV